MSEKSGSLWSGWGIRIGIVVTAILFFLLIGDALRFLLGPAPQTPPPPSTLTVEPPESLWDMALKALALVALVILIVGIAYTAHRQEPRRESGAIRFLAALGDPILQPAMVAVIGIVFCVLFQAPSAAPAQPATVPQPPALPTGELFILTGWVVAGATVMTILLHLLPLKWSGLGVPGAIVILIGLGQLGLLPREIADPLKIGNEILVTEGLAAVLIMISYVCLTLGDLGGFDDIKKALVIAAILLFVTAAIAWGVKAGDVVLLLQRNSVTDIGPVGMATGIIWALTVALWGRTGIYVLKSTI